MAKSNTNDPCSELAELVKQRQETAALMADMERKIYNYEGSYLEDTQGFGNIVHGWNNNNLRSGNNVSNRKTQDRRHSIPINDAGRIFSNSSVTSNAAINSIREAKGTLNSEMETACSSDGNKIDTEFEKMYGFVNGVIATENPPAAIGHSSGRKKKTSKSKKYQNH